MFHTDMTIPLLLAEEQDAAPAPGPGPEAP